MGSVCCFLQGWGFGGLFFFSLIIGFMISAFSSQPGQELLACEKLPARAQGETSWGRGGLEKGRGWSTKASSQVLLPVWEAERELEGGGMGRQAETQLRREE